MPWLLLALVAGVVGDRVDRRRLMVMAAGGKAAVLASLAALEIASVTVVLVVALLVGFATVWWNVVTLSLRQRVIPDHLLSRVLSAYRTIGWGTAPVGMLLAGVIATLLEPEVGRQVALSAPFLVSGALSFVLAVVSVRKLTTARIRAAEVEGVRGPE